MLSRCFYSTGPLLCSPPICNSISVVTWRVWRRAARQRHWFNATCHDITALLPFNASAAKMNTDCRTSQTPFVQSDSNEWRFSLTDSTGFSVLLCILMRLVDLIIWAPNRWSWYVFSTEIYIHAAEKLRDFSIHRKDSGVNLLPAHGP